MKKGILETHSRNAMCGPDFSSYLNKRTKQNKKTIKTFKTYMRNGNLNIVWLFFMIKLLIF